MAKKTIKTNHINFVDTLGRVYCYHTDEVVEFTNDYFDNVCSKCPYLAGSAQGKGIECLYADGSNDPVKLFHDPHVAEVDAHNCIADVFGKKEYTPG